MDSNQPLQMTPEQLLLNSRWVRGLAVSLVGDPNVADDVVQQTWLAALERPGQDSGSGEERRAWLARVLRNFVLQRSRSESRRAQRERLHASNSPGSVQDPEPSDCGPGEPSLVEQVDSQRAVVQEALNLSEPTRTTLLLRYFKGHSSAEIARIQNVPAATVRSRLSRGLEELRARMSNRYDGDDSAWCSALLAGFGLEASTRAATSASAGWLAPGKVMLQGVVAMKIGIVLTVALSAVALTAFGVSILGSDGVGEVAEAATPESPLHAQAPTIQTDPIESQTKDAESIREAIASKPTEAEEQAIEESRDRESAEVLQPCRILARFVDAGGNAVSGVRWQAYERKYGDWQFTTEVQSEAGGLARMQLELEDSTEVWTLRHCAAGFVRGVTKTKLQAGKEINVGTIVLTPSVQIEGQVVDANSQPVTGARVFARGPKLGDEPEGQMRRVGPSGLGPGGEALEVQENVLAQFTDADGHFEIEGAASESIRLWASADGYRYGWTEPLRLVAGQPTYGAVIVLERLIPEDRIAGVALDSEGEPLPGRYITYQFSDENMSMSAGVLTDSTGAFDLTVVRSVPHDFKLNGDRLHPGSATKLSVAPGTLDLVLKLSTEHDIALYVQSVDGKPITDFKLTTRTIHSDSNSTSSLTPFKVEGDFASIAIPAERFELEVARRGFVTQSLGPYYAESCPPSITCVLEAAPGIHGVLLDGDEPIPGAKVELYSQVAPGVMFKINDFPARLRPNVESECVSDETGAFVLFPEADGEYVVRAQPPEGFGLAAVESAVLNLSARSITKGLVLQPSLGGTLEVHAIAASNQDAAGTVVGISDGGAVRISKRANADGVATFRGLRPGSWVVMQLDAEVAANGRRSAVATGNIGYSIPWSCDVRSGATTKFELELE